MSISVGMVAGEASGDLLAGLLLDGMRTHWPDLTAAGIGGPEMARQGFDVWWPSHTLSVHGYGWEVLRRYHEILGIRKQLQQRLLDQRPAVFIGVDAPDFNLDLECNLRLQGIKTVHFVCPSIWAWRPERVAKIRRSADHVLCLFPFEPALLEQHGIDATYVGHPLASTIPLEVNRDAARTALGLQGSDRVLAILPGSRTSEIRYLARPFFEAAKYVREVYPDIKLLLPAVPNLRTEIEQTAKEVGMLEHMHIITGQSHTVLAACDVTLIASGTATLEAALHKCPMVIAYRMGNLSWHLMRRKQLQPWVGLPNILSQSFVVPELLQNQATPEALAHAVLQWFDDIGNQPAKIEHLRQQFQALHRSLQRDTPTLASHAIAKVLGH